MPGRDGFVPFRVYGVDRYTVPNAGQYGATATLPSGGGGIEPPILTQRPEPIPSVPSYSLGPTWGSEPTPVEYPPLTGENSQSQSITSRVMRPWHRPQTWQQNAASNSAMRQGATSAAAPTQPYWFQRGYVPPTGIQAAIQRGDYQTAYGQSPMSAASNYIMDTQRYAGNPNNPGTNSEEPRTMFRPNAGGVIGRYDPEEGVVARVASPFQTGMQRDTTYVYPTQAQSNAGGLSFSAQAYNDWLRAHNPQGYQGYQQSAQANPRLSTLAANQVGRLNTAHMDANGRLVFG